MQFTSRNLLLAFTAVMALQFGFSSVAQGDLIGYWPFDEVVEVDGETTTPDKSPDGGHDGVLTGGVAELAEDGARGTVMNFGEFNNMAVVNLPSFPQNENEPDTVFPDRGPGFNAILDTQEVTISYWLNREGVPATNQVTFTFDDGGTRQLRSHAPWSNGQVYFDVAGCCGANQRINVSQNGADTDALWHHLAYVKEVNRDQSDLAITAIFQDGVAIVSSPGCDLDCWNGGRGDLVIWDEATIDDVVPITGASIGAEIAGTASQDGMLDDFAIWDEALSTERIVGIAGGGSVIPLPPGVVPGDFNDDMAVDSADFLILSGNLNDGPFPLEEAYFKGDLDGNLRVDLKDFLNFRGLFEGQGGGAAAAAVPEPTTGLLMALASLALFVGRRRR